MANLLDIRRRIRSVKNTQQITRALRMISAAKLRRAQEQAMAARPYAEKLRQILAALGDAAAGALSAEASSPAALAAARLLEQRPEQTIRVIVISSDQGRAGAFNTNVVKAALEFQSQRQAQGARVEFDAVGRKARDLLARFALAQLGPRGREFGPAPRLETARELAAEAAEAFAAGRLDAVYLAGNEFKNVLQQRVRMERLLPITAPAESAASSLAWEFAPSADAIFSALLPRYLATRIFAGLLESFAAEHAARMNAMDTASRNASDMIEALTLHLNRVRQAAITKEIIEVVSGAAALTG